MLVFDFDGVLIQSLPEIVVSAWNAVSEETAVSAAQLPPGFEPLFNRHYYLLQGAGNMLPLARWCREKMKEDPGATLTRAGFLDLAAQEAEGFQARAKHFFTARLRFQEKDYAAWLSLQRPYEPLWSALRRAPTAPVIVTNKNRKAVQDLCSHFELQLPDENVYSGDGGNDKISNLTALLKRTGGHPFSFVEDSLLNLREVTPRFPALLTPLLAAWGYLGTEDTAQAGKLGYRVVTQDEVIQILNGEAATGRSL